MTKRSWTLSILLCTAGPLFFAAAPAQAAAERPRGQAAAPGLRATDLRVEYRHAPLGIDVPRPRLSWVLTSTAEGPAGRGQRQTAYELLVASTATVLAEGRGDLWSTGRVRGDAQVHVVYGGKPLASGQVVHWKVRVWDRDGVASDFSPPATFETALLSATAWKARWIEEDAHAPTPADDWKLRPAPLFRREITLGKPIARARAYVSGLGYHELSINGRKVGDHVLSPGWTTYSKRVLYVTHDVTPHLREGKNALGLFVGNGWWNPLPLKIFKRFEFRKILPSGQPRAILQLQVEYRDGSREVVVTDGSWKVGPSGLLRNDIYLGEVFDRRAHPVGWDEPGFDDGRWRPARLAAAPVGPLVAEDAPPIRVTRTLEPVALTEPRPGVYVFDFGQNFAGWVTLRARGPAGTRVRLRFAELLYPDGTLNGMTTFAGQIKTWKEPDRESTPPEEPVHPATAWQQDVVLLAGKGTETYTPRFTFHGFRYVEVTGLAERPTRDSLQGLRLNSDVEPVGTFSSSNELQNRIREAAAWSLLSNIFSVESDCPHRERLGYGGDIVAASEFALLQFDMGRFYAKAARDLADAARPSGGFTETSPFVGIADEGFGEAGPLGWTVAHPVLLRDLFTYYGDRGLLEEQYGPLVKHVEAMRPLIPSHVTDRDISDHEMLGPRPRGLTATAFWYQTVRITADVARRLGKTADARRYGALAARIAAAFQEKFVNPTTGAVDNATQTTQSFALYHGLLPEKARGPAFTRLVEDVAEEHDHHLTTGIFGVKYVLDLLPSRGRPDVAARVVNARSFPSFGYMLDNGATTLWEAWRKDERVGSHNHPMFGSVHEYLMKHVAGIAPAEDAVGMDRLVLRPQPTAEVTWARGSYRSVRGAIVSDWRLRDGAFVWDVVVPVGAAAVAHVPIGRDGVVTEAGRPAREAPGIRARAPHADAPPGPRALVLELASGSYRFTSHPDR